MAENVTNEKPAASAYEYLNRLDTELAAALKEAEGILRRAGLWSGGVAEEVRQCRYDLTTGWVRTSLLYWGQLDVAEARKRLKLLVRDHKL